MLDGATIKKVISERDSSLNKAYVVNDKLIYTQNYFIDSRSYCCGTDDNAFIIYDLSANEKLNVGDVRTVYNETYNLKPIVMNSKLYYLEAENGDDSKCVFKSIGLDSNLKISMIKQLDGKCG